MPTPIKMPQLGESVVEGTVTRWLKKEGERVEEFEALLEVNTDKVDTEIPSPASGILVRILVEEGTTVRAGTLLAEVGAPDEPPVLAAPAPAAPPRERELGFISPIVARLAAEHQVDLSQVKGTGEGSRITKKDVLAYIAARPASPAAAEPAPWETPGTGDLFRLAEEPAPLEQTRPIRSAPPPAPPSGGAILPLNPMRKAIADHMVSSKHTSPHVTTVMEVDMTRVTRHRDANRAAFARDGAHLTFSAYFAAALVAALKAVPLANSSWSDAGIVLHPTVNLGIAVALGDEGLIVPVIRGADGMSLLGLARAINDLAARARERRLQPDEVKGGTFTLTNHGNGGSLFATPIINQPQSGILGAGLIQKRAVVIDDAIAIRPMVYLSYSFDHRILDGASADRFLAKVAEVLNNWS